ncbi:hypothetical protein CCUS01_01480 [Colletotrichum cuscutae]|uniref:Uncharacterized protein n=1 Tax=Colletotrichum cuscutae TaxID=1209917 RepID=A0AAI9XSZ5_9PEZI|nr:hypothetical protein CCUS01_01480 [Colletotrichum cuscutae]
MRFFALLRRFSKHQMSFQDSDAGLNENSTPWLTFPNFVLPHSVRKGHSESAGGNIRSCPCSSRSRGPSARDDLRENGALNAVLSSVTLLANGRGDINQAPRRTGDCRILHHRRRNSPLACPVWPALDVVLSFCRLLEVAALHRKPFRQCDGGFGSLTEQYREPGDGKKGGLHNGTEGSRRGNRAKITRESKVTELRDH